MISFKYKNVKNYQLNPRTEHFPRSHAQKPALLGHKTSHTLGSANHPKLLL